MLRRRAKRRKERLGDKEQTPRSTTHDDVELAAVAEDDDGAEAPAVEDDDAASLEARLPR